MKVKIIWKDVAYFRKCGHGVEIHYNADEKHLNLDEKPDKRSLVAFVVDFNWRHGDSNKAEVRLLRRDSPRFAKLGVDGDEVRTEIKQAVEKYVTYRKAFPHIHMVPASEIRSKKMSDPISRHLTVWVNG